MASRIQDFVASSVHGEINLINAYVVFFVKSHKFSTFDFPSTSANHAFLL